VQFVVSYYVGISKRTVQKT